MKRLLLLVLAVGLAGSIPLSAQLRITGLEALESKATSSVVIGLDPDMLKLAAGFLSQGSPETNKAKALIEGLKSITVHTLEFPAEGQYKLEDLTSIREQLRAPGWSKIVSVDERVKGQMVEIYTKREQDKMSGLAIIAAEPKELAIVSIEGTIDLASLAQLGGQFGIPNIPIPAPAKANPKGKGKQE